MTDAEILELGKKRAEEIGLKTCCRYIYGSTSPLSYIGEQEVYSIDDIHRLLGAGQGYRFPEVNPTHEGLLIAIRPIVPETREQKLEGILRELMQSLLDNNLNERLRVLNRAEELLR